MMQEFLELIKKVDSNVVIAISTAFYTLFTFLIIREMRAERRQRDRPRLNIFIKPREDYGNFINLVIENNGLNGASEVSFKVNPDINIGFKEDKKISSLGIIKNGISFLEPNGKREFMLMSLVGGFEKKIKLMFTIDVIYKDLDGKIYKESVDLGFAEFEGMTCPPEPPIFKIKKSLEKIERDFHNIATGFSKPRVITQTKKEKQMEDKEWIERHEKKD